MSNSTAGLLAALCDTLVPGLDAGRNKHWLRPRLLNNSGPAWCRSFLLWFCLRPEINNVGADSPSLPAENVLIKSNLVYLGRSRVERSANSVEPSQAAARPIKNR